MLFPVAAVWVTTIAVVAAALAAAALQARRAVGEVRRIQTRVDAYASLPIVTSLAQAAGDAERLNAAIERIDPLVARARKAAAVIREGPIPPDVVAAVVRIGVEVQNLREFAP